jgi:hypothetical protein
MDESRKKPLKDVEVPLRDQVLQKLVKKLEDLREGQRTIEIWHGANAQRADWLSRQQHFQRLVDEFLTPIHPKTQDWSSNLHLPVVYTAVKTMHARFMAALLDIDPPFSLKARQSANAERVNLVEDLMRYALKDWVNYYQGIDATVDPWIWDIIASGSGTLKLRWDRKYTRFMDVVEEQRLKQIFTTVNPETGETERLPQYETVEVERETTIPCFIGPAVECVLPEDLIVLGGGGDPQLADEVIQQSYMTEGELWTLADQNIFRKSAVEKVIDAGENRLSAEMSNQIKTLRAETAGNGDIDSEYDLKRYQILERYAKIDVDGSGIPADVILWVHKDTAEILRATYLYRSSRTGKRPYFRAFFHQRRGDDNGVGLPELLYSLAMEIDAMHNMKVDFGLISSMPFGFYRPTSSMTTERIPFEPGMLAPLDNPQADVYFPQLGAKWSFTAQEEVYLQQQVERMTSISDLNLGVMSGTQGAARTATGARALLGESNANLNVYLKRINRAWKQMLVGMFELLQDKLPEGFEFRVFGDDGHSYYRSVKSREELAGMYDFELEGNSANSNKGVQIEQANSILMTIANPLYIQLGIVSSTELYNALKNKFQVEGVRDFTKFLKKPQGPLRIYSPEEIANATLAGVNIQLSPEQDLQGFIDYWQYIEANDELLGQFSEQQTIQLFQKVQEAQAMMQAIQAQQAQVANQQQVTMNAAMAQPTPQGAGAAAAAPQPQEPPQGE